MNSSGHSSSEQEVHQGYDLETGLLAQFRQWVDLLPWLRLLHSLRVAGSPSIVLITALVFGLWWWGRGWLDPPSTTEPQHMVSVSESFDWALDYLRQLMPTALVESAGNDSVPPESRGGQLWRSVASILWSILVWTPLAMFLARQGALLTARRRSLAPLAPAMVLALRRTPAGWLATLIPLLCTLPFLAIMLFVAWVSSWFGQTRSFQWLAAAAIAVTALPCGLLAFGANIAIPLSWAALVNERDPDALDALSRGYEYLWRRPVSLVLYAAIAAALLAIVGMLATGVAWSAAALVAATVDLVGGTTDLTAQSAALLWRLPQVILLAQAWTLVGGVYLLVRRDANGQEVEDLWQLPAVEQVALPDLPE